MFPTNNSPFAGLVKVILALVIIGVLAGLVLSGSDLANFITNTAKAPGITQKDKIDIDDYQRSKDEDFYHLQQLHAQELQLQSQNAIYVMETTRIVSYVLTGAGVLVAICIAMGIAILLIQFGRSRLISAQAQTNQARLWKDPTWREQQILIARQKERMMREKLTPIPTPPQPVQPFTFDSSFTWDDVRQETVDVKRP